MVSKSWCFTWNNYTQADIASLEKSEFSYLIYGKEVAKTGTLHLQGTIVFRTAARISKLKKIYGKVPHWEPCKSLAASINYCKKEGNFKEIDHRKKSGPPKKQKDPNVKLLSDAVLSTFPVINLASVYC